MRINNQWKDKADSLLFLTFLFFVVHLITPNEFYLEFHTYWITLASQVSVYICIISCLCKRCMNWVEKQYKMILTKWWSYRMMTIVVTGTFATKRGGVINALEDGTTYHLSNQCRIWILSILLDHLSANSSKSVEIEGSIRKPFDKDLFDQSYNICSIFGRKEVYF
jgi:hypothetical protein